MPNARLILIAATLLPVLVSTGCLTTAVSVMTPASPGVAALDGGIIGRSPQTAALPAGARGKAIEAEYQALQFGSAGEPVAWSADGYSGNVVPTQVYRVGSQDCRAYTQTVEGAAAVRLSGTACRNAEGLWVPVA